jgi:hypothetical protein
MRDCKFKNVQGRSFIFCTTADANTDPIKRVHIINCSFDDCGVAAMQIELSNDIHVEGCSIYDTDGAGIFITGGSVADEVGAHRIVVSNNTIRDYGAVVAANGIEISGGGNAVTVTGNVCQDGGNSGKYGISIGTQEGITCSGNTIIDQAGGGIVFRCAGDISNSAPGPVSITGNVIKECAGAEGIVGTVAGVPQCVISGNSITTATRGVYTLNGSGGIIDNLIVANNAIRNVTSQGIWVRCTQTGSIPGERIVITGNMIETAGDNGINLSNGNESIISNNIVYNATLNGILFDGTDGGDKVVVSNNLVYDCTQWGIDISHANFSDLALNGNICTGNGSGQITLAGTTNTNRGSFTAAAAATTVVTNTLVTEVSRIIIVPTNAAAATLMAGGESLYVSAKAANTSDHG